MATIISTSTTTGITLSSTSSNPITVTGTINATSGIALYGKGGGSNSWTITNSGTIKSTANHGVELGSSKTLVANGVITNSAGGYIVGTSASIAYGIAVFGPGTLVNASGGTIKGQYGGAGFQGNATITNAGVIAGDANGAGGGVYLFSGMVTNAANATISGHLGVLVHGNGAATITNFGTINGVSVAGAGAIRFDGTNTKDRIIENPGAAITGGGIYGGMGVLELASAASAQMLSPLHISNFSTIQFDSPNWLLGIKSADMGASTITGFTSSDTIDLTDFVATTATFASNALVLSNASTIHPTLHIQGSFSTSDFALTSDGKTGTNIALKSLHNPIAGSYTSGVTLPSTLGSSISVTGQINVSSGTALYGPGGSYSWTVDNSGAITGGGTAGHGIQLGSTALYVNTSDVTNRSTGTITGGAAGVLIDNIGTAIVANTGGSIQGGQFGVAISGAGKVTNSAEGQIAGTSNAAIYIFGDLGSPFGSQPDVQVYNAGSLTGGSGVNEILGGTVTNVGGGTIVGITGDGVDLAGPGTVINSGMVSGNTAGIFLQEGGSVTNLASGIISGGYGVFNYGFGGYGGSVTNAGTIIGTAGSAVQFKADSGSNYRLTVDPGAVFVGAVSGGGSVVELGSGSSTGTLYGFGSTITNFNTLQFDKGGSWNISGDQSGLGTMAIVGLAAGDVIDLTDFSATDATFASGTLTLTDSNNVQAALSFPDKSNIGDFEFAPDGAGGTDIAGAGTGQTLTWTSTSDPDWNTATNWSPAVVPTSFDTAIIANPGSTSVTIAAGTTNMVRNLLVNSPDNTLEVDGSLNAVGTVTIDAGSLIDVGTLTAAAIDNNGMLATRGTQTLDNIPIGLGGTLQAQAGGTLILGTSQVITQTGSTAVLDSTTSGGESIINQSKIDGGIPGGSLTIAPLNFINQGTILVDNETATIGFDQGGSLGSWDNTSGTIALSGTAALVLDGSLAVSGIGTITGATGVTEAGLLDNTLNILNVGTGTPLGTLTLASDGTISGGIVGDPGGGILFKGGTLSDVLYQGPMELLDAGASATVSGLASFLGSDGVSSGTIDLTGIGATLQFASVPILDNAILNIGNTKAATVAQISGSGTFAIGTGVTIDSNAAGALATLNVGNGTDLSFGGTLDAVASGGTFTLADSGGTFSNNGTITAGNGDTLDVNTDTEAGSGVIRVASKGTVDVSAVTVDATQTFDFADGTGVLRLVQPNKFQASISGFETGDSIDLIGIQADTATWSSSTLTIDSGSTTVATLSLLGDYSQDKFTVASDGATGSAITVTAICYAAGTRILTPHGEVPIERLHRDDLVMTLSGRPQPIRWIGQRRVDFRGHPNRQRILPVRITAHAFGEGRPKRNLLLSPDHAIFVDGVLIPIRHLINGTTITQIERRTIIYYHIELQRHDVLLAEGMPAESYLEAGARSAFDNGDVAIQLHPEFAPPQDHYATLWEQHGYAPLVVTGEILERVRASLAAGSQCVA